MRLHALCTVIASTLVLANCGPSQAPSQGKIVNGLDAANEYPAVVFYRINPEGKGDCSGTFLSDSVLITAGHCLRNVAKAEDISLVDTKISAVDFRVNAKYTNIFFRYYDMALIKFPAGTAPATMSIAAKAPAVGNPFKIVGFGATSDTAMLGLPQMGYGAKRVGTNQITRLEAGLIIYDAPRASDNTSGQNSGTAPGDSGGALLIGNEIAGVCRGSLPKETMESVTGLYVNIHSSASKEFLAQAKQDGWDIPGLEELKDSAAGDGTEVSTETINAFHAAFD